MEQELIFGLDVGQSAVLKKKVWADYEQILRVVFSCFQGQFVLKFFQKHFSIRTKKLHKMMLKQYFFFLKIFKEYLFLFLIG